MKQSSKLVKEFLEDNNPEAAKEMGRVDVSSKEFKDFIKDLLKVVCKGNYD